MIQIPESNTVAGPLSSSEGWEAIADILRQELQEHGGMVNLLNDQRRLILERNSVSLQEIAQQIEVQIRVNRCLKERRILMARQLATQMGIDTTGALSELVAHLPIETRGLFEALIEELRSMIVLVQRRAQVNHGMLKGALEIVEETAKMIRPHSIVPTYDRQGSVIQASAHNKGTQIKVRG